MNTTLLLIGSILIIIWGLAHLFPTQKIVDGFGDISKDNKQIILMEWVAEGLFLCFLGMLVLWVTIFIGTATPTTIFVIRASATMLILLAIVSFFTIFHTSIIWNKLCGFVKSTVAILFLLGTIL
ncbi:MAG: hypothetical protein V3V72_12930 [Ignavibacteriaceae bacterium]